jgi:hypothetical protein
MRQAGVAWLVPLAVVCTAAAQAPPADLMALAARARLERPVAAWCRGEFRPGHPSGFAVAIPADDGGGRYLVLEADASVTELSPFARSAGVSCYTRAEAAAVDATIRQSLTVHGRIAPRWNTTIVCAFVDETTAECWQYSPADRTFVRVGGWVT